MAEDIQITAEELDVLKVEVLNEKIDEVCEQLGDPGRYFASFKAKDLLSQSDCEEIKSEKTSIERCRVLIEKIVKRRGRHNEHPYDVFVGALKRMRVHVHIVRILNTALAAKKAELHSTKRSGLEMRGFSNGFPSSGASRPNSSSQTPRTPRTPSTPEEAQIVSKGPTPSLKSNTSTNSSPISSTSSSHGTTPPHLSSPQTDTDGSLLSPPSIPHPYASQPSSGILPILPDGYNEAGQRIKSNVLINPTVSEVDSPLPTLPPGFDADGRKIDDISEFISSKDSVHPSHGPMPAGSPSMKLPLRSNTSPETENAAAIAEMKNLITQLQTELSLSQERVMKCESEILMLHQQNEELLLDNKRLSSAKNQFESYISIVTGTAQAKSNGMATTPYTSSGNWSLPSGGGGGGGSVYNRKRSAEPVLTPDVRGGYINHRHSEPNMLNVPARPNKLPLNKRMNGAGQRTPNSIPNSYSSIDHSPMYEIDTAHYLSRQSPGSDFVGHDRTTTQARMSSSRDDITSGEDKSSVRSFESGNSGNITLTAQISTTETIV